MALRVRLPALTPDALAADDDRALMRRFAESRDEAAFAAVVARHARMVYGVCRRAIRDEHLAEDAFQAVFLVLAKNPARAAGADAVGGWLFGIARRVGLAARRREERHAKRAAGVHPPVSTQPDFDDLLRVLDEELAALPEVYRAPLVACYLEERTQDEAARQLGWSLSTLRRRLDRGKELLRARLTRRGATLAGGLFAGALAPSARAAVPARLLEATAPGTTPSQLASALATEVTRGSVALKAGLAAIVIAMGLGGVALSFAEDKPAVTPDKTAGINPAARLEMAPAPRPADGKKWVTLRGRVVFPEKRDIPAPREVPAGMIKDATFFGPAVFHQDVLIDPKTRGLANAVVWLRPDSDEKHPAFPADRIHPDLAAAKPVDRTVLMTRDGFSPRVTAARAGDQLLFSNPTPIVFNVRYDRTTPVDTPMDWETGFNVILPPGQAHATKPLPALRVCDLCADQIHPWLRGYVWVFDHPYFAVTDPSGNFEIRNAPAGKWRLVVWHEKVGYRHGAKGRTGESVTLAPGVELKPLALESDNWDAKDEN
jgi:RNA polymerase sigma factor (sigma-70 family)